MVTAQPCGLEGRRCISLVGTSAFEWYTQGREVRKYLTNTLLGLVYFWDWLTLRKISQITRAISFKCHLVISLSVSVVLVADLGHSRSRAFQEKHGGALLPQRPCRHLCVRRDESLLLREHSWVDRWVQPTLCGAHGAAYHGGQQVWPERPPGGLHLGCAVSCRQLQFPTIWDFSQGPCWEGTCWRHLSDFSL